MPAGVDPYGRQGTVWADDVELAGLLGKDWTSIGNEYGNYSSPIPNGQARDRYIDQLLAEVSFDLEGNFSGARLAGETDEQYRARGDKIKSTKRGLALFEADRREFTRKRAANPGPPEPLEPEAPVEIPGTSGAGGRTTSRSAGTFRPLFNGLFVT